MSILDLPIEKQKQIAANLGQPFDVWVRDMQRVLSEVAAYRPKKSAGNRSPESIARAAQIQARMDAETPSHKIDSKLLYTP